MKIFLRVTRFLISAASSLHIGALRGAVYLDDRRVARAMNATDTATVATRVAEGRLKAAMEHRQHCHSLETAALRDNYAFRAAAQAEASQLKRDAVI